ncbi:MAG: DNA translocase FtsK 4TM domain-containing protein [Oscillospiraceae bacterium]|nr:DNA translocase FtsK 4TM domain-containing protein [Oscillospiraceae bacterium]
MATSTKSSKSASSGKPAPKKSGGASSGASSGRSSSGTARKSSASGSTRSRSASGSSRSKAAAPAKDPIAYRGLKAFVLLALALFSLIGCFTGEGIFIGVFREFVMGLIGKGFYFLPFALGYCALMLLYVRDKPLGGRITCTLLLTVMAGALIHLFDCTAEFPADWHLPGALYDAGRLPGEAGSGGVIGGLLSIAFSGLFNKVGAAIVLFLATLFLLFAAVNVTVAALVEKSRERAQLKAEEWKLRREEEQEKAAQRRAAAEEARLRAAEERAAAEEARRAAAEEARRKAEEEAKRLAAEEAPLPRHPVTAETTQGKKRRSAIDIPLDPPKRSAIDIPLDEPRQEEPAKAAPAPAPKKTEPQPARPDEKPVSEKDWLAAILTKDRIRASDKPAPAAASSASDKIVNTAIRPKPGPGGPVSPVSAAVKASQLPQAPLPQPEEEDEELFGAPRRPAQSAQSTAPAQPSRAPDRPAQPPKPSTQPTPAQSSVSLEEAAAVLAEEKAARTIEKAESAKARAEMVASIEGELQDQAQAAPVKYVFPPLSLLTAGSDEGADAGMEEMSVNAKRLSATIKSFGIPAEICDVTRGPTVTRYEVELEQGVKLNRLTNLSDDIALALGVSGVRIAPVPDKISIVGIEVPNKKTTTVYLRDVIDTSTFREKSSSLTFAIGKDIGGTPIVGDIAKLPHLLIAGTTGSGKSVCMNSLILSLLYKSSPEEVRLIMVDPKMIELGVYNGIPHLLIPVVTDPKKAAGALQWSVMEMTKRYTLMADAGVRDLVSYNKLMERTEGGQKLPKIVILIDELADLMMTSGKEVEESIVRIAQMGRAGGIHLVLATQRPSADVITGIMKANISSRIAFAVDSALNSRIILDTSGAEKLVGKGDMLYAPIGTGKPTRVQGTFVTDEEREDVINFVKEQGLANYDPGIQDEIERNADKDAKKAAEAEDEGEDSGDLDELFNDAVEVVLESKQASVSLLQRRLKLGYSRAARIVDQLEEQGVVGPFEGSKPRPVLITREEWAARQGGAIPGAMPELPPEEEDGGVPEEID